MGKFQDGKLLQSEGKYKIIKKKTFPPTATMENSVEIP